MENCYVLYVRNKSNGSEFIDSLHESEASATKFGANLAKSIDVRVYELIIERHSVVKDKVTKKALVLAPSKSQVKPVAPKKGAKRGKKAI